MFSYFYFVKNHDIDNNSTTAKAIEKIRSNLESLEPEKFFDVGLAKFESKQILFNKISHRFLVTNKLFGG